MQNSSILRKQEQCSLCGVCAKVCCSNALEMAGRQVSVSELLRELEKDIIFYDSSKGGITISGGEPLAQGEFSLELLQGCKKLELHTVVDTSGFGDPTLLEEISKYTDLFLYDMKLMDDERHKQHTGVSNKLILENLALLSRLGKRIWVRIPVIPGINDDEDNIAATAAWIRATGGIEQVNLLTYHNTAMEKYKRLHKQYQLSDIEVPGKEHMEHIADLYHQKGVNALIGG